MKNFKNKIIKKKTKERISIHLSVDSALYPDPSINYYSVVAYCGDLMIVPLRFFHENDFECKGNIVSVMVLYVLQGIFSELKKRGLIKDYGLY